MSISRRQFILGSSAASALALTTYSYKRGLRIPPFHWEPRAKQRSLGTLTPQSNQMLLLPNSNQNKSFWRATAPEPKLSLNCSAALSCTLEIQNLAANARLVVNGADHEEVINGTQRTLKLTLLKDTVVTLSWHLAVSDDGITFASIGDSGGDLELGWCIHRAKQLGADFLLHLGDFNYQDGDYQSAINHFKQADLPVYISIGNHDFHDNGGLYGRFIDEIGPLNQSFNIAGHRFLNIDTAAGFFPLAGGQRGQLLKSLKQQKVINTIAFTHCPLQDPANDSDHDIGSEKERAWLVKQLRSIGVSTMLSGHIHINHRSTIAGIDHLIVGQGLGHQDLLVGQDHSKMALGKINKNNRLDIELADLAMPMELHCHPRTNAVKNSLQGSPHQSLIKNIEQKCAQRST